MFACNLFNYFVKISILLLKKRYDSLLTKTCIYVGVSNITNTIYSLRFGFCKYPFWLISTTFYKFSRQRFFLLSCVSEWISNKIKLQIIFVQISRDMWKITIWSNQQWLWLSIPPFIRNTWTRLESQPDRRTNNLDFRCKKK